MWLRFLPFGLIVVLGGLLALAHSRIETLDAELERAGAECNTRIANGVADAQAVAREAMGDAIRQERIRWKQLVVRSNDAAQRAEAERVAASDRAEALQDEIEAIYRRDSDAAVWRDTPLPGAVAERLQQ